MLDEPGEPLVPPRPRALQRLGEDERLAGWPLLPGGPNQVYTRLASNSEMLCLHSAGTKGDLEHVKM